MIEKRFDYKGQMINYYNKLCAENGKNGKIKFEFVTGGRDKDGYFVQYQYKKQH